MLISVRQLVDRMRHPRSRADDLARLRARFAAAPSRRELGPEAEALALELRQLREEMSQAIGDVDACSGCSAGHPLPFGRYDGGHCCGGGTFRVFTPTEVAALKMAGTRATSLRAPRTDHVGCAFRGPVGCTLAAADRPTICVRYICRELRQELRPSPKWEGIAAIARRMDAAFRRLEAIVTESA